MLNRRHFVLSSAGAATLGWPLHSLAAPLDSAKVLCGFPAGGTPAAAPPTVAEKRHWGG